MIIPMVIAWCISYPHPLGCDLAMDLAASEILGDLRARLHQRVDFEVRDVERRLRDELSGLAADARSVAAAPGDALGAVDGASGGPGGDLDNEISSNELRVSMMFTQEPSKDEFKAMVQRQSSYAYAWATGSRVKYTQRSEQLSINSLMKAQSASCMKRIVQLGQSPYFDAFWALVITSNAAFLGFQLTFLRGVDLMSVQVIYAVLFAIELILRLVALGCREYFFAPGWGWNWLDDAWTDPGSVVQLCRKCEGSHTAEVRPSLVATSC